MSLRSLLLILSCLLAAVSEAATLTVGPADNWCREINRARPGDVVQLESGRYLRPCRIGNSGRAGKSIVLTSVNTGDGKRAQLAYPGNTSNVLEVFGASHIQIRGLDFGPTQVNVDAIRIRHASDILIEDCRFTGIAGISVATSGGDTARVTIRDNVFKDLQATGIYIGCHQGDCRADDVVVTGNLIDGVDAPEQSVGYGLQLKRNAWGVVSHNRIFDTKGPGIMVYGALDPAHGTLVEGNYVQGSRTDGGIVIGAGPALVRNNIAAQNAISGIVAQDYNEWDLQERVRIVHNTVLHNLLSGIRVQSWRPDRGNVLANNAIVPLPLTPALEPEAPVGEVFANLVCDEPKDCFRESPVDPYEPRPRIGGALHRAGGTGIEPWRPVRDFYGVTRGPAASIGAIQGEGCGGQDCRIQRERPGR